MSRYITNYLIVAIFLSFSFGTSPKDINTGFQSGDERSHRVLRTEYETIKQMICLIQFFKQYRSLMAPK